MDVIRTTLSLDHNMKFGAASNWASAVIFGSNTYVHGPHRGMANSLTLETDREYSCWAAWGRWESVERLSGDLDLPGSVDRFLWVHALTAGVGATVVKLGGMELMLGGQGTVNAMDESLESAYGAWPVSGEVYLRLRPAAMIMKGHGGTGHGAMEMDGHAM